MHSPVSIKTKLNNPARVSQNIPARVSDSETLVYLSASKHHTPYPLLFPLTFNLSGKYETKDETNITQIKSL